MYTNNTSYVTTTIASGAAIGGVFRENVNNKNIGNVVPFQITGFSIGDAWTDANLKLQAYNESTSTWEDVTAAASGNTIEFVVAADKRATALIENTAGLKKVRVVSVAVGDTTTLVTQAADRTVTVYTAKTTT